VRAAMPTSRKRKSGVSSDDTKGTKRLRGSTRGVSTRSRAEEIEEDKVYGQENMQEFNDEKVETTDDSDLKVNTETGAFIDESLLQDNDEKDEVVEKEYGSVNEDVKSFEIDESQYQETSAKSPDYVLWLLTFLLFLALDVPLSRQEYLKGIQSITEKKDAFYDEFGYNKEKCRYLVDHVFHKKMSAYCEAVCAKANELSHERDSLQLSLQNNHPIGYCAVLLQRLYSPKKPEGTKTCDKAIKSVDHSNIRANQDSAATLVFIVLAIAILASYADGYSIKHSLVQGGCLFTVGLCVYALSESPDFVSFVYGFSDYLMYLAQGCIVFAFGSSVLGCPFTFDERGWSLIRWMRGAVQSFFLVWMTKFLILSFVGQVLAIFVA